MTRRDHLRRFSADRRGIAMTEFALLLPIFLGFVMTGIEFAHYVMAHNRVQRLASMSADLVAQSGVGAIGASEAQIYDLFSAMDLTARPFDLRRHGRIVITSVRGTDNDNNNVIENRMLWQRFDGQYTSATPLLGCRSTSDIAIMPAARLLPQDEILFHVQVTYDYQPIFSLQPFNWLDLSTALTRTATYRARSTQFQSPSASAGFPPKSNCTTATGL